MMNKQGMRVVGSFLLLAFAAASAQAQTIYRIVGPDGKVTFSDKAPPASSKDKAARPPSAQQQRHSPAPCPMSCARWPANTRSRCTAATTAAPAAPAAPC